MPRHDESRHVPYSLDTMFDLVADVERYPEFLPWCVATRIRGRDGAAFVADLVIGFKLLKEKYTSRVHLDRDAGRIRVEYLSGPFRSKILQSLIGHMFGEAVRVMVDAFEKRAHALYGDRPLHCSHSTSTID